MRIKITPLSTKNEHFEGSFRIDNNYYLAKHHSAGIITEIKKSDNFGESEMFWVSRSEIPFVTAIRHTQSVSVDSSICFGISALPILRRHRPCFEFKVVDSFPSNDECMQLIYKYCSLVTDNEYRFYERDTKISEIETIFHKFDYEDDLLVRAGACLYKAYILLDTSGSTFAEETYTNTYIALEAIIEDIKIKNSFSSKDEVLDYLDEKLRNLKICPQFKEYEKEMRDGIRNDIIHPFRKHYGEKIAQPFLMADYVYEDLPFVDLIFKNLLLGEFYL